MLLLLLFSLSCFTTVLRILHASEVFTPSHSKSGTRLISHTQIQTRMHSLAHTWHTQIYTHICTRMGIHRYIHTYACACLHTDTYTRMHTHGHTQIYTHVRTRRYIHTYAHACTRTGHLRLELECWVCVVDASPRHHPVLLPCMVL